MKRAKLVSKPHVRETLEFLYMLSNTDQSSLIIINLVMAFNSTYCFGLGLGFSIPKISSSSSFSSS
jgi:hypothetical protein